MVTARRLAPGRSRPQVVGFDDLLELSTNLRWTWQTRTRSLFARLDPAASPSALEWPRRLLLGLGRATVEERLASDPDLAALAAAVVENAAAYEANGPRTWFPEAHRKDRKFEVAYFAAEFALTDSLPIFAGGLGAVAGEFLKSASALGVHARGGRPALPGDVAPVARRERCPAGVLGGAQPSTGCPSSWRTTPTGRPVRVKVRLPGRDVVAQVWTVLVGRNRLYLLDTDVRQNRRSDRAITARLYGGDQETRIQQELVLGIGGVRALAALGHEPEMAHLNEGHAAFAGLERIRQIMSGERALLRRGPPSPRHRGCCSRRTPRSPPATTTSRPSWPVATSPLTPRSLGIELETLLSLGRYRPEDPTDSFCPTVLAIRLAGARNGVSRLHGAVTREQWGGLWPRLPVERGARSATSPTACTSSPGSPPRSSSSSTASSARTGRRRPVRPSPGASSIGADDEGLWDARCGPASRLVESTRVRQKEQLARRGAPDGARSTATDSSWTPDALTIGFVGRFVAYKRPDAVPARPRPPRSVSSRIRTARCRSSSPARPTPTTSTESGCCARSSSSPSSDGLAAPARVHRGLRPHRRTGASPRASTSG